MKRRQEREPDGRAVTVTGVGSGGQGVSDTQSERYGWRNEETNGGKVGGGMEGFGLGGDRWKELT